jgi:hypothetical protein
MSSVLASRIGCVGFLAFSAILGCSGGDKGPVDAPAAADAVGGASTASVAGSSVKSAGSSSSIGGNTSGGGTPGIGGSNAGGAGTSKGGAPSSTSATGGTATGGTATGGTATGGTATGGTATGGTATGGKATGGVATGGVATGGAKTSGGTGATAGARPYGGASNGGSKSGGTAGIGAAAGAKSAGGSSTGGTGAVAGASTGGTGATGNDGCSDTLALGLTMSEVAVFQSGKISIMKAGAAVTASTQYGADVIEGRPALFRVYVTTDSGFQSRQLSARLTLNGGSTPYYAKQTIAASSAELTTANTFQIQVPASEIKSGLNYSVQIVECATGSGTAHSPQFPATGTSSIATRATGVIKLTLVPMTANNITPTLDSVSTGLKALLEAEYPTTSAQITVATTPITGCKVTPSTAADGNIWSDCLTLVRNRRTSDKVASDVYYMGVITPASSLRAFCGSACIAGIGYVATGAMASSTRAAMAIGYVPEGLGSIAHELGHNHGLEHSPGCGADQADSAFPYVTKGVGYIGWVGWDSRSASTFLDPAKYTDIMAYCDPVWVSDYVYSQFADRIASLNGAPMWLGVDAASTWRVLDVINGRATWGVPLTDPVPPSGIPESGTILDSAGNALLEVTVYRTNISDGRGAMYLVPEPSATWAGLSIGSTYVAF